MTNRAPAVSDTESRPETVVSPNNEVRCWRPGSRNRRKVSSANSVRTSIDPKSRLYIMTPTSAQLRLDQLHRCKCRRSRRIGAIQYSIAPTTRDAFRVRPTTCRPTPMGSASRDAQPERRQSGRVMDPQSRPIFRLARAFAALTASGSRRCKGSRKSCMSAELISRRPLEQALP